MFAEVYAPWFKANSTQLVPAVQAAVAALKSPVTSRAAALAMSALCDACRRDLAPHVSSFAGLVRDLEGSIPVRCICLRYRLGLTDTHTM
jgi:hypothetical protein